MIKTPLFLENPGELIVSPNSIYRQPFRLDYGSCFEKPNLTFLNPSVNDPVEVGGGVVYRPNDNVIAGLTGYYRPSSGGQINVGGIYEYSNPLHPIWAQVKPSFDWKPEPGTGNTSIQWNLGGQYIPGKARPGGPEVDPYTAPSFDFYTGGLLDIPINNPGKDPVLGVNANFIFRW